MTVNPADGFLEEARGQRDGNLFAGIERQKPCRLSMQTNDAGDCTGLENRYAIDAYQASTGIAHRKCVFD
jgi:hypothetical protein